MNPWMDKRAAAYLGAKEVVDARSRNAEVFARLAVELRRVSKTLGIRPLRILELGAGNGGLAICILELCRQDPVHYVLLDSDADVLRVARTRLEDAPEHQQLQFVNADALEDNLSGSLGRFDCVIGQSLFDLLDLREALPRILALARPHALFYAPVTFNGGTEFSPPYPDRPIELALINQYHRTMDRRAGSHPDAGGSRAGWVLRRAMGRLGADILAVGASDWFVTARGKGTPEQLFLDRILGFFGSSLRGRKEIRDADLYRWLELRRQQLRDGQLILHIHNLDLLARLPG